MRGAVGAVSDVIKRAEAQLALLRAGPREQWGALIDVLADLISDLSDAQRDVLLQAARLRALESELATLQASVVDAMSSAGPAEDERTA